MAPKEAERPVADPEQLSRKSKLGAVSGVYIPVCLNILSILMFLRFGLILGRVGLVGILGLLATAYVVNAATTLSLSAIASNGEVKGGGAYYLISRSLGPEFGGSIGILFYLAQVLNTALNVVGLIDCLRLNLGETMPHGYWWNYLCETIALVVCTALCLAGSGIFARASNALLVILVVAILSIPASAIFMPPFEDPNLGIEFTGISLDTLRSNLLPHTDGAGFRGAETFRELFGILFPATSGIFAGASMSGDLRNPSKSIPVGTLWAMLSTLVAYLLVVFSLASSTRHSSLLSDQNIIQDTSVWAPLIFAGECATTLFSTLMGVIGSAKLLQALARDKLFPGLSVFGMGTRKGDEPVYAIFLTYVVSQLALFANLNQIATFISMGYQMTFFVMNLACFLLKIGSAPNFRPAFKFFAWQTAFAGSIFSAAAMFFIDGTYATTAVCLLVFLFLLIHYLSPPKHWGDVSQNLIYHQVRKYLLRLKPEHIKFWRPQIILFINDPRRQTRLIQFCNSLKKGSLYILGHVIVADDFAAGVQEAKLQQAAWTRYVSEYSRIKAFVQLTMSPTVAWGVRSLILSAGLGGMRPNIAVLGFYNMDELRASQTAAAAAAAADPADEAGGGTVPPAQLPLSSPLRPVDSRSSRGEEKAPIRRRRRRGDTSARLLEGFLPTDVIRTEGMMDVTSYLTILEDLALRYRLNVAVGKGFETLESPYKDPAKKYIDLWPIQMSAEISADGKNVLTTNFDTYTLILQLGYILHSVPGWKTAYRLRVMAFVEYESEVEEERGRVVALLDKLRIDAEIHVFSLASGLLGTYEMIVNGRTDFPDVEDAVNTHLRDEDWWDELQSFRGAGSSSRPPGAEPEELASIASVMMGGASAAAAATPLGAQAMERKTERKRASTIVLGELPRKSTVSTLARLGVSMGLHTQNLPPHVLGGAEDELGAGVDSYSDSSSDGDSSDAEFHDAESAVSEDDEAQEDLEPDALQPLLSPENRRQGRLGGGILDRPPAGISATGPGPTERKGKLSAGDSYGTMTSGPAVAATQLGEGHNLEGSSSNTMGRSRPPPAPSSGRASGTVSVRSLSPEKPAAPRQAPARPPMSRQSSSTMKFSSLLMPETKIVAAQEGSEARITFADSDSSAPPRGRPPLSRQTSAGRFSSRPLPETRITEGRGDIGPSVSFAEPATPARSRKASPAPKLPEEPEPKEPDPKVATGGEDDDDGARVNIPELLLTHASRAREDDEAGSAYSTQGAALSFNDLPSRGQHLILNELLRQNSDRTAVLLTTLPVPEDGTCQSEEASLRYLVDVELLCSGLPPVLLVLSNNMTFTVSL